MSMTEPVVAQKAPFPIEVEAGKSYFWCACGLSKAQPFCDGSHAGTDITPTPFKARAAGTLYFCGCKQSAKKPFCDGAHNAL
jgi:CDGSH-type Zn-finger protein